jgi:hypothetical protein
MKRNDVSGTRYSLDVDNGIVREPWSEVVQKIADVVSRYKNNFSVKTDGALSGDRSKPDIISKLTITIEIFTR